MAPKATCWSTSASKASPTTWVNGFPKYTDLVMKNPQGLPLAQSMAQHFRSNFSGPFIQDAALLHAVC